LDGYDCLYRDKYLHQFYIALSEALASAKPNFDFVINAVQSRIDVAMAPDNGARYRAIFYAHLIPNFELKVLMRILIAQFNDHAIHLRSRDLRPINTENPETFRLPGSLALWKLEQETC
jgi:hypothetical protein